MRQGRRLYVAESAWGSKERTERDCGQLVDVGVRLELALQLFALFKKLWIDLLDDQAPAR